MIASSKLRAGRARRANADRSDRSRQAILAAATPVFAERGYAGASLNEIIRASGLTKGGFYFHFKSKLALALAVIEEHERSWGEGLMAEVARYPRAVDRLFAQPRILARMARRGEGPAKLSRLIEDLGREPRLRRTILGSLKTALRIVADQFREAQAEGTVRADLDADLLSEVAVGGFFGLRAVTAQLADDDLERRVDGLIRIVQLATLTRPEDVR